METYQQRVVDEKEALDDKLGKLLEFQDSGKFRALSVDKRKLLNRQEVVMELYSDILAERIALFLA